MYTYLCIHQVIFLYYTASISVKKHKSGNFNMCKYLWMYVCMYYMYCDCLAIYCDTNYIATNHTRADTDTHKHTHTYMHAHIHTHAHTHTYMHTYTHMHTHTCTQTYTHTHTHTHTHTKATISTPNMTLCNNM